MNLIKIGVIAVALFGQSITNAANAQRFEDESPIGHGNNDEVAALIDIFCETGDYAALGYTSVGQCKAQMFIDIAPEGAGEGVYDTKVLPGGPVCVFRSGIYLGNC
ncbi:hypothetical protein [Sphingomonas koreensis]|uniref:hypothetical protein n=1 Tax=Sphingomonas koreensis TaxID=93064 RepID=UPI000A9D01C4|nr:hypothetical protein [Sphingomonas koreensis]PJI88036.1 hypothetical protein BDW16_1300 [Sphingomonas koreensis]